MYNSYRADFLKFYQNNIKKELCFGFFLVCIRIVKIDFYKHKTFDDIDHIFFCSINIIPDH